MTGILKSLFGSKEEEGRSEETYQVGADVPTAPVHVTDQTFEEVVLASELPVLVDFWAPWCGPCRMIAPIVTELATAYAGRAVIAKVNTDENAAYAGQLGIMGIPTLIFFNGGQEVDRIVGFANRRAIEDKLRALVG